MDDESTDEYKSSVLMFMEKMHGDVQESFRITSTSKYFDSRYWVMNSIGFICCYNDENEI